MIRLQRFLKESHILDTFNTCIEPSKKQCTRDLQALHVCFTHWYLGSWGKLPRVSFCSFPLSQIVAYSKPVDFPIFLDDGDLTAAKVNMPAILHMINFWRFHMRDWNENNTRPKGWTSPIVNKHNSLKGLSRLWRGTYGKS